MGVQGDFYQVVAGGNGHAVPEAGLFFYVYVGGEAIVNGTTGIFAGFFTVSVHDLDFDPGEPIGGITGADEDTAVGTIGNFEFEVEYEVGVGIFGPDVAAAVSGEDAVVERPTVGFENGVGEIRFKQISGRST